MHCQGMGPFRVCSDKPGRRVPEHGRQDKGLRCDGSTSTCNGKTNICIAFGPGTDGDYAEPLTVCTYLHTRPAANGAQKWMQHVAERNRRLTAEGEHTLMRRLRPNTVLGPVKELSVFHVGKRQWHRRQDTEHDKPKCKSVGKRVRKCNSKLQTSERSKQNV